MDTTNEELVIDETLNTSDEEEIVLESEEEQEQDTQEEETDWKALALKEKARADNQKIRAEKAEKEAKAKAQAPQTETKSSLDSYDVIALMDAKVTHKDDIKEVEDYAKFRGISVAEALKSSVVKTLLAEKKEQRNVALATNTGNARVSSKRVSDDVLLNNARTGKPVDDVNALVEARFAAKFKK